MQSKKILVTCALPYANGPIHLGHMLEHIQADIWVRYRRMCGDEIYFISADDAHGTPIMLKAKASNIQPERMINKIFTQHIKDLKNFYISYDNYHTTHSQENYFFSKLIFNRLKKNKLIKKKIVDQLYDKKYNIFLPDRLVQGTCPFCYSIKQNGDHCNNCGRNYESIALIKPISILSGTIPIIRKSEHYFFILNKLFNILKTWIMSGVLEDIVINKVLEWFNASLKSWDITRDKPYFGFNIPNTTDKYFYVWLDAPIGYISTFYNFCSKNKKLCFYEWWKTNSITELYHFIGKDIIYFHSLFWPAILEGSYFRKPTKLFIHGHVTLNGYKMSKSQGTFITAKKWLQYINADSLRYYYATKISNNIDDIDLNLNDIAYKVNSDIVNKIVNIASRTSYFINNYFYNTISKYIDMKIYLQFVNSSQIIHTYFIQRQFSHVIQEILCLADIANKYIDTHKPWITIKKNQHLTHNICSLAINMFRIIMIYIKPIMPDLSKKTEIFLNTILSFKDIHIPLLNHQINKFVVLFERIDENQIKNIISK
ncbi:methionine--tRNA ligase [Enterobacteriaceae endosymbiont of Neohaemonia nigricornis]|uniref:methionine--tRNA ligase n=1 Tax=Enterobacteriaceae endosymbiont of Neohaemonia nigricornis TaxID=2675792 RepID=UPI0014498E41|nr:methionine--tRNA ligase [Enterobacteriaceae endosymbiont of Neohaemonia nigricornis]QJC30229.1 methionine--tRNA ligase [Enterobacteriaceae endosymbiont of Neohaemonia nigricornis]